MIVLTQYIEESESFEIMYESTLRQLGNLDDQSLYDLCSTKSSSTKAVFRREYLKPRTVVCIQQWISNIPFTSSPFKFLFYEAFTLP
jgi:hypothetical protein